MKRTFALLLSVLLAMSLTACGKENDKNNTGSASSNGVTSNGSGALDGAAGSGSATNGSSAENGLPGTDGHVASGDVLTPEDTGTGLENGTGAAASNHDGTTAVPQSRVRGASYDQMLRNARVHDTDGNLWDHENAMTPGAASSY